jgi:hypothetical protein
VRASTESKWHAGRRPRQCQAGLQSLLDGAPPRARPPPRRPQTHPPLRHLQQRLGAPEVARQLRQVQRGAVADLRGERQKDEGRAFHVRDRPGTLRAARAACRTASKKRRTAAWCGARGSSLPRLDQRPGAHPPPLPHAPHLVIVIIQRALQQHDHARPQVLHCSAEPRERAHGRSAHGGVLQDHAVEDEAYVAGAGAGGGGGGGLRLGLACSNTGLRPWLVPRCTLSFKLLRPHPALPAPRPRPACPCVRPSPCGVLGGGPLAPQEMQDLAGQERELAVLNELTQVGQARLLGVGDLLRVERISGGGAGVWLG